MASKLTEAQRKLNAAKDAARRRAMGPPLKLGDVALDTLATVSEADVPAAEALWALATRGTGLESLLDAKTAEE